MIRCPACSAPVARNDLTCPACGISLNPDVRLISSGTGSNVAVFVAGGIVVLLLIFGLLAAMFVARATVSVAPATPATVWATPVSVHTTHIAHAGVDVDVDTSGAAVSISTSSSGTKTTLTAAWSHGSGVPPYQHELVIDHDRVWMDGTYYGTVSAGSRLGINVAGAMTVDGVPRVPPPDPATPPEVAPAPASETAPVPAAPDPATLPGAATTAEHQ